MKPDATHLLEGRPIRRIALFAHPHLGDAIHLSAVAGWVKAKYPESLLTVFTSDLARPVWELCPAVDQIENRRGSRVSLMKAIRAGHFDLAIFPYGQNTMLLLATTAGVKLRVGVEGSKYGRLLHAGTPPVQTGQIIFSSIEPLMRQLGFDTASKAPLLDFARLPTYVLPEGKWFAVQSGASHEAKRWELGRFVEVARRLGDLGWKACYVGSAEDAARLAGQSLPEGGLVIAGKASIHETMAALRQCRFLVTNDSGPMHMSGAVGTPAVALFGPTAAGNYEPPGEGNVFLQGQCPCAPRSLEGCTGLCMDSLDVESVVAACRRFIA